MVLTRNKSKPLSSVNHTSKTIHHYHLHHGHDIDFHCFVALLNSLTLKFVLFPVVKFPRFFSSEKSYTFCATKNTMYRWDLKICLFSYFVKHCSLNWKIFFTTWGLIPLKTLNFSVARNMIFWWWIEKQLSLSRSSSKSDFLSLNTMRRHRSCNRFVLLFKERLQPIQIKGNS